MQSHCRLIRTFYNRRYYFWAEKLHVSSQKLRLAQFTRYTVFFFPVILACVALEAHAFVLPRPSTTLYHYNVA